MNAKWLVQARGSFNRASEGIKLAIDKTDLTDQEACRIINDRLMRVRRRLFIFTPVSGTEQGRSVQ